MADRKRRRELGVRVRSGAVLVGAWLMTAVTLVGCGAAGVSPDVQTGRADVNAAGDGGSISTTDWTYSLPTAGINWVDRQGNLHDGGRPECLAPGTSADVNFAAVEVHVGASTWRAVVWISCQ
jgi:hypothetical protein